MTANRKIKFTRNIQCSELARRWLWFIPIPVAPEPTAEPQMQEAIALDKPDLCPLFVASKRYCKPEVCPLSSTSWWVSDISLRWQQKTRRSLIFKRWFQGMAAISYPDRICRKSQVSEMFTEQSFHRLVTYKDSLCSLVRRAQWRCTWITAILTPQSDLSVRSHFDRHEVSTLPFTLSDSNFLTQSLFPSNTTLFAKMDTPKKATTLLPLLLLIMAHVAGWWSRMRSRSRK